MYISNNSHATAVKPDNSPVHLNDRYRPRNTGIGYGKSSGYASSRLYSPKGQMSLVRVR